MTARLQMPIEALEARSPFSGLRERDIDLLLCAELHARRGLANLLARRAGCPGSPLAGAWVSHDENDGESDLVMAFETEDGLVLALAENKIAAPFQPEQGLRYAARAQRRSTTEGISRVVTVLIAPDGYMSKSGAEAFEVRIPYEELSAPLREENDPRSQFLADALEAGVEALRRGYIMTPDAAVSGMWQACWKISRQVAPKLNFNEPGLKPRLSTWFHFKDAEGLSQLDWSRVVVVYKAERGHVDLQFGSTTAAELSLRSDRILQSSMKVERAAKSASIRVRVPIVDFAQAPEEQHQAIVEGFAACELLRSFFVMHARNYFLKLNKARFASLLRFFCHSTVPASTQCVPDNKTYFRSWRCGPYDTFLPSCKRPEIDDGGCACSAQA
ncbi:PD-(D/E)XK nuclease family protein [Bradyrhizobium sp. C-145]|uniref:PD-(D/E)XK nuclease family protein n=1 Tax=Bradyrhizobium sp. C-145 TaxID=574727 RepID=UPI00201B700B|nr:PD-(D/E)XK nuclease family protein [Bradyrhizobium sp. C-145]UQR61657.1 PD-(D/E)XK nuclease family protein [Bradyrhizobium sp. C-145]